MEIHWFAGVPVFGFLSGVPVEWGEGASGAGFVRDPSVGQKKKEIDEPGKHSSPNGIVEIDESR